MDAASLRQLLVLANAFKQGDLSVGGTADDRLRDEARRALGAVTIGEIRRTSLVDDGVTASLDRSRDRRFDHSLDSLTVAHACGMLLGPHAASWARQHRDALPSEVIAAVAKVLSDDELSFVAKALFNPLAGDGVTIGAPRHFGSRIQPNSPGDAEDEIVLSILEGLAYGCGDVIIGLNPASDDLDTIVALEQVLERVVTRLDLPTRFCVLSDIVTQRAIQVRTRVDVGFQSLAGTSRALDGMVGLDVDGLLDLARGFDGLYFETGQGSAVTNGAAEGVDMVTLEARAYGVARHIRRMCSSHAEAEPWMIVNDVAGFIGPEVFSEPDQLERACLEDTVMAKLHGLTMGLDVCATFHMEIAPDVLARLTSRIAERAAPAYLMAVAGSADPMLGYMTTSFRQHPSLRHALNRQMTSAMAQRLASLGIPLVSVATTSARETALRLYAAYTRAGGDHRSLPTLEAEGARRFDDLQARGFDVGGLGPEAADARLEALYVNARSALHATVSDALVDAVSPRRMWVRTLAATRAEYLASPPAGERLQADDARAVAGVYPTSRPQVQMVISDGLNANAINEQVRALLPTLRRRLRDCGIRVGEVDVIVRNGRVRVGYEIGGLVGADLVIHLIGERPGTGLNTMSAYVTYGRDEAGQPRWSPSLDHSLTTAVCGIHPRGTPPSAAAEEIARVVTRALDTRRSGVSQ